MIVTLRRSKDEPGTSTGSGRMTDDRLEWHLWNWSRWMRGGKVTVGFQKETVGMFSGASAHFDDMADANERRLASICDVVVTGLPYSHYAAISNKHLYTVYKFPRNNEEKCLELGMEGLRSGLEVRGIW